LGRHMQGPPKGLRQLLLGETVGPHALHLFGVSGNQVRYEGVLARWQIPIDEAHQGCLGDGPLCWMLARRHFHCTHQKTPGFAVAGGKVTSSGTPSRRACSSRRARASRLITVPMGAPVISAASL